MARARTRPSPWLLGGLFGWIGLLLLAPLGALVWEVLTHLPAVYAGLATAEALRALGLTLGVAAVCVVLNCVLGVVAALVLVRQRFWGRGILDVLTQVPLAVSPVMTGLSFLLLTGRQGLLRPWLDAMGLQIAFAWPGVLIVTLFVTLPFTVREVALVLQEIGQDEEWAAATLGASAWQTFWRITLPNIRHALGAGFVLTLARALGEFGAALVVGGAIANRTQTATTFLHAALEERQGPAAYGMALLLGAVTAAVITRKPTPSGVAGSSERGEDV